MRKNKKQLNSIIIGLLLGNGYISKDGYLKSINNKLQKEYCDFKKSLLCDNFITTIEEKNNKLIITCNKTKYLKQIRKYIYTPNKKIDINNLKKLDALGLSLWYLDNGYVSFSKNKDKSIKSRKGFINTSRFSYEQNIIFQRYFKEVLNIETKIYKKKEKYILYFKCSEFKKLIEIIEPYIIESMKYKICLNYINNINYPK